MAIRTKGRIPGFTIGGLWKHKATGDTVELLAQNRKMHRVQVTKPSPTGYLIITENMLKKDYTMVGIRREGK